MQQHPSIKFRINLSSGKYISNLQKKANLCDFLTKLVCKRGQKELAENKLLIIGEGLKDVVRCESSTRGRLMPKVEQGGSRHNIAALC